MHISEYSFRWHIRNRPPKTIGSRMKQLRYFQTDPEEVHGIIHAEEIRRTRIRHFLSMMDEKKRKPGQGSFRQLDKLLDKSRAV